MYAVIYVKTDYYGSVDNVDCLAIFDDENLAERYIYANSNLEWLYIVELPCSKD